MYCNGKWQCWLYIVKVILGMDYSILQQLLLDLDVSVAANT